jgi:hypothetical protein
VDLKNSLDGVKRPDANGFVAAYADGSVRFLEFATDPAKLSALLTATGGETVRE